jgi:MFS family permease
MTRPLWVVIVSAGSIMALAVGLRHAMGLYLAPISADLGIGREAFALGMGLMNLMWGLAAPFAGAIADRHGTGRVAVAGALCYAAGFCVMTFEGSGGQLLVGGALIGVGLSGTAYTVILGPVGRAAASEQRSSALGLASVGGSVGQLAALPLVYLTLDRFGWQASLLVVAAGMLLIVPMAAGIAGRGEACEENERQTLGEAFEEACRSRSFWLLNTGFFVCGFQLAFVGVHLPAYLDDRGFEPWLAAAALTVISLCNILGSYVCGVLGGRHPKKDVLTGIYLARSVVFLAFLALPTSVSSVLAFSAAMGFLWLGTVPLTSGLVAHLFGTRYMSMLFGFVFLGHQIGGFLGAWMAGSVHDRTGSYDAIWWICVVLGVAAAALHWPIAERSLRSDPAHA